MALKNIVDAHHVVRYCKRKFGIRNNGKVIGVYPEFFHLRDLGDRGIEGYLSGVLYEFFCPQPDPIRSTGDSIPIGELKAGEALVKLNAGRLRERAKEANRTVRVLLDTSSAVPAKARIEGLPYPADPNLCSVMASSCIVEIRTI